MDDAADPGLDDGGGGGPRAQAGRTGEHVRATLALGGDHHSGGWNMKCRVN